MKKKIFFALLLAAALLLCSICALAEMQEENTRTSEFELDAYGQAGGMLVVTYDDGSTEETGSWGFSAEVPEGSATTIGEILSSFDFVTIDIVSEDDVFEGFMIYEIVVTTDEDGWDTWTYVRSDDALYSAAEVMALPAPESYTAYVAKWANVAEEDYFVETEDDVEYIVLPSVTLYSSEGLLIFQPEEGEAYEASMSVSTVEEGQLVHEALELDRLVDVTCEGKTFAGWNVYEVMSMETIELEAPIEDENVICFQVFSNWYCIVSDYELIAQGLSTQELGEMSCSETDLLIIAQWE